MATDPLQPNDDAANVIRAKVARLYDAEPDAVIEEREAEAVPRRSKHQQFMYDLGNSGKDLATVQTEWHQYYLSLPEHEKHQVWQEFYSSQSAIAQPQPAMVSPHIESEHKHRVTRPHHKKTAKPRRRKDLRTPAAIQATIRDTVTGGGKLTAKDHLHSLLFGLGVGAIAVFIVLFTFFNELIIAPFIQPSRTASATPLIVTAGSMAPTKTPEVIIPKINLEIPVDYSQTTTDESQIENALEAGVVHYPTTVKPGENGNAAFFGHSSNNILNPGKFKFAFLLLHTMVPGDTFYLTSNGKLYVYKVISKTVVDPSDVSVLGPVPGQTATATLITCDPPGTSLRRLILVGQQISPAISTNTTPAAQTSGSSTPSASLPGNGPTLFHRWTQTAFGKLAVTAVIIIALVLTIRWIRKPAY